MAEEVRQVRLNLQGEVMSDDWADLYRHFGFAGVYCPGDVRSAIDGLEDGEELVLEINSVGGEVYAANEIYSLILGCSNPTRAEIQSLAASAASYLVMGCDRVDISRPAQMMIHRAAMDSCGNSEDHRWAADQLDVTDESILDTYCAKAGEEHREELRAMMEAETYLSARQAVELGLCDGILGEKPEEEDAPEAVLVASVAANTRRAMRCLPDIRELQRRRAAELEAADWQRQARLELERARFGRLD